MRHLYGIALGCAMTLVAFFAGAWGYDRLLRLPAPPGAISALPAGGGSLLSNSSATLSLAAVVATGLLAGILIAVPQISPLGAGLPGLFFLGWTALYLASVQHATELIPLQTHAFGAGWEAMLFNGVLAAAGLAMIIPMFVPSRWRRPRTEGPDTVASEAGEFLANLQVDAERQGATRTAPATRMRAVGLSRSRTVGAPDSRTTGITGRVTRPVAPGSPRRSGPPANS